jgi:hypothetical protein
MVTEEPEFIVPVKFWLSVTTLPEIDWTVVLAATPLPLTAAPTTTPTVEATVS